MRFGLVGAGFMGGVHLNAYAGIPEVEVVGVADPRTKAAVAGAEMIGARPYASYEDLVAAEDVEVVDVCLLDSALTMVEIPSIYYLDTGEEGGEGGRPPYRAKDGWVVISAAGREMAGRRVGLIAAVLVAIYPQIWRYDGMVLSETMVIVTRNVDLSVGSVLGLSAYAAGTLFVDHPGISTFVVILAGLGIGRERAAA